MSDYEFKHWARAIAASIPNTGFLVGVTGGVGSGKSSLVRELSQQYEFLACYPGKIVRERMKVEEVGDLGSMAPDSCEDMVRAAVADSIVMSGQNSLVIDGFPRSRSQMKWMEEISIKCVKRIAIVVVQANPAIRRARVKSRGEAWDEKLLDARMREEDDHLQPFLRWLPTAVPDVYLEVMNGIIE